MQVCILNIKNSNVYFPLSPMDRLDEEVRKSSLTWQKRLTSNNLLSRALHSCKDLRSFIIFYSNSKYLR